VDLRDDLEVSRHVFRGESSYILHDPVSFKSHRFNHADYQILVSLSRHRSLGSIFESLVASGGLTQEREREFYEFILFLHRAGFLSLPIADGALLYRRYLANQALKRSKRWLSFVYLDIPVWDPDGFLGRTVQYARPFFTLPAVFAWLVMLSIAIYTGIVRRRELAEPLANLLAIQNLLIMWFTLAGLKLIHELGHAYACKCYGLRVPTLGVYLVAGVPCAYVDASASWSLPNSRARIVICLAGMYFESVVAAISMFVWAATSPGLWNAIAYNTMFLAGVATVLFNLNPLMKYDGYFILCDLVQIPNLGQRAQEYTTGLAKKLILGLSGGTRPAMRAERTILLVYGLTAPVYRVFVLCGITILLASRFYTAGLLLGTTYIAYILVTRCRSLAKYLWHAQETAPVRPRAVAASIAVFILAPTLAALLPIRTSIQASGITFAGTETRVRAETAGFLTHLAVRGGETVQANTELATLANDSLGDQLAEAEARLRTAEVRREAYRFKQPAQAIEEDARAEAFKLTVRERKRQSDALTIRASQEGTIRSCLQKSDIGRYIPIGGEIAVLTSGLPEIRFLLDAEELTSTRPSLDQQVDCRLLSAPGKVIRGVITSISPAGNRGISLTGLTHLAGGGIVVQPETGQAMQPYFMVVVSLQKELDPAVKHGMRAVASLPSRYEPMGLHLYRRMVRFMDTLQKS